MELDNVFKIKARFVTEPEGARIFIDGKYSGKNTPALIENLTPDTHTYRLVLEGYEITRGSISPMGWKDFTAQVTKAMKQRKKERVRRMKILENKGMKNESDGCGKYDPDNYLTWDECPACGAVAYEYFKYRKHECECRACRTVFRMKKGKKYRHPLQPWKDPQSLYCSKELTRIMNLPLA